MSVHQDPKEPRSLGGGLQTGVHPLTLLRRKKGRRSLSQPPFETDSTDSQTLFNIVYLIDFQFTLAVSRCAASGNGRAFLFVCFFAFQKVLNLLPLFHDSATGDVGGLTITVISRKIRFTFSLASLKFI